MPVYRNRTLNDYPVEYYRCRANEEGYEFTCPFCGNSFKTKSARISHMKKCCIEHNDEEYSEEVYLDDNMTVGDYFRNVEAVKNTIKHYLNTNELLQYVNNTGDEIREKIKQKLISNEYSESSIGTDVYLIYKFFFEVTEEERHNFVKTESDRLYAKIFGDSIDSE
jgi:hypothetical protein